MSEIDFKALRAPFPASSISWRLGSTTGDKTKGMALAFIDARDVMERLDAVVGAGRWQNRYPHAGEKTVCEIGIQVNGEWVWKSDGAGNSDVEAEKGALSDAFKRAAVRWGIGQYLYGLDSPWVEIEPMGNKSHKIKASEMPKLRAVLDRYPSKIDPPAVESPEAKAAKDQYNTIRKALADAPTPLEVDNIMASSHEFRTEVLTKFSPEAAEQLMRGAEARRAVLRGESP